MLNDASMKRSVTVSLGEFALSALGGEDGARAEMAARLVRAISYYLGDADSDHPGWPYPAFLRTRSAREARELAVSISEELWEALEAEASRQDVSTQQLAEHAALYYAAELDAGRVTERIIDDLGREEA